MEPILVSVIIPVYDVEAYLPACLDSVLNQTLRQIEVICVDDASPDGCGQILDAYARQDDRVKVIHLTENRRQGYGRNLGLDRAVGTYIYLMDSDDLIKPATLENLAATAQKYELDGLFFDSDVLFEREEFAQIDYQPCRSGRYEDRVHSGQELFQAFWDADDWNVYIWRQFWRREYLQKHMIRFPVGAEHEDEVFSVEAAVLAGRTMYLPERYAIHRYRPNSVMTREKSARDFHGYYVAFRSLALFGQRHQIDCRAFEENLSHLFELVLSFHPLFLQEGRPEAWFQEPALLEEYRVFAATQRARETAREIVSAVWQPLKDYRQVYLYGAGKIARAAGKQAIQAELDLAGCLVTDLAGNPSRFMGKPVIAAEDWTAPADSAVVIAVAQPSQDKIAALLRKKGCAIYRYLHGRLLLDDAHDGA